MHKQRLLFYVLVIVMLLSVLLPLVGCDSEEKADEDTIKFGIIGPISDPTGQNVVRPAEMMIEKINAEGGILGKKVEIIGIYDDHWETAQAITAFETLVQQGVDVILGGSDDDVEAALLSRIGATDDILYLSVFASTMSFMENVRDDYESYKNYFMYTPIDDGLYFCVEMPAEMLRDQYGWTKVYMIREDMVWTEGIEGYFREYAPQSGFEVVGVDVVPVDVTDLTPYLRNAQEAGAEMIFTMISVFGEALAIQAWEAEYPIPLFGHNGVLNDYGHWGRSGGAWGPMTTTSTWGSLEMHSEEWRDFIVQWFNTYNDDPRTPMWLGESTWRAINSYKDAAERAGTTEINAVIAELENIYYPNAPVRGGFYGHGEGDWPHTWAIPIDINDQAKDNPDRGVGLWVSSYLEPMSQWQPVELAPNDHFILPDMPDDYGRLVTIWPPHLAGGDIQFPPFYPVYGE